MRAEEGKKTMRRTANTIIHKTIFSVTLSYNDTHAHTHERCLLSCSKTSNILSYYNSIRSPLRLGEGERLKFDISVRTRKSETKRAITSLSLKTNKEEDLQNKKSDQLAAASKQKDQLINIMIPPSTPE